MFFDLPHCLSMVSTLAIIVMTMASTMAISQNDTAMPLCQFDDMDHILNMSEDTNPRIECCICLNQSCTALNESEFQRIFGFNCSHSSRNVCIDCWTHLLYRHGNKTKCPLCRACKTTKTSSNLPYAFESQLGYVQRSVWQRILLRMDIRSGCIGLLVYESCDLLGCIITLSFKCMWNGEATACLFCCPICVAGSVYMAVGLCATNTICLSGSLCCCMDCCHVCLPEMRWREFCFDKLRKSNLAQSS